MIDGGIALPQMSVAMGQPVTTVTVASSSASVNVNSTLQMYAAAQAVDGSYVYTAPGGWTWDSGSSAATVDSTGLVTGKALGTTNITATQASSGQSGSSTVNVLANGISQGKWTVMVFLNAANSLYEEAPVNVNQMEKVANNPNVRFVIQWKQSSQIGVASDYGQSWSGTRRYLAAYDTSSSIKSTMVQSLGDTVDMGSGGALSNFVDWAKTNYPADHYALVVWDHGSGWFYPSSRVVRAHSRGVSLDETTGNILSPEDIKNALVGRHVDVLAYDACLMQSAEMLFETSTCADYIAASEDDTPGDGYPYDTIFKPFADNPDAGASTLVKNFATGFTSHYSNLSSWSLQQSVIQTSKISAFRTALDNFGLSLVNNRATLGSLMTNVRSDCSTTDSVGPGADGTWRYYDLDQICERTAARSTITAVTSAATAVRSALADMTLVSSSNSTASFLRGLSIEFSPSGSFNSTYASQYSDLQIATLTHWDEFLSDPTANP